MIIIMIIIMQLLNKILQKKTPSLGR